MTDTKIIRELALTYKGHCLWTNHSEGIRDFMKLHEIPGATQVINLVKVVNFDRLTMEFDWALFVIMKRGN